jgi:methyl-accepting chemotaxis protein
VVAHQASQTIVYLADAVKASAQQVEQLGQESEEISRITAVIKDIAEQTNLLALNAAIEAARAGETGRGFAVVADEVRKLAERTSMATEDISRMVQAVQQETVKAVAGMRSGAQHVEQGVQLVEQAKGALHDINQKMQTTTERVSEISFSAQQQNQAVHTLEEHLGQIAVMTEQNRVVVSSTSDTVAHLNKMVLRMEKSVTQYRVKG